MDRDKGARNQLLRAPFLGLQRPSVSSVFSGKWVWPGLGRAIIIPSLGLLYLAHGLGWRFGEVGPLERAVFSQDCA